MFRFIALTVWSKVEIDFISGKVVSHSYALLESRYTCISFKRSHVTDCFNDFCNSFKNKKRYTNKGFIKKKRLSCLFFSQKTRLFTRYFKRCLCFTFKVHVHLDTNNLCRRF